MRTEFDHGGAEALRLSTDDAAVEVRRDAASTARANLSAFMIEEQVGLPVSSTTGPVKAEYERASYEVVAADRELAEAAAAEFAELAAMLGLDIAAKQVGICARTGCDKDLSLTGAASSTGGGLTFTARKKGFCSQRCMKLASLKDTEAVE